MKNVSQQGTSDSPVRSPGTRSRVVLLMFILVAIIIGVGGITFRVLYKAAFEQQRIRLTESARSWSFLIQEMAKGDVPQGESKNITGGPFVATLQKIIRANKEFKGFGKTGEFTLATRQGNTFKYLLPHRHDDPFGSKEDHPPVLMGSKYGQPMQKALSWESGWMISNDYRGETVLAAYEALPELNLGVVAKIDLAEIRTPFIHAGIIAAIISVAFILLGILLFRRVCEPIITEITQEKTWLATILNATNNGIMVKKSGKIIYVNNALVRMFGYDSSADILGQRASIIVPAGIKPQDQDDADDRSEYTLKGRKKDGAAIYLEASVSRMRIHGGENIIAIIRNVTKLLRTQENLQKTIRRLNKAQKIARMGFLDWNLKSNELFCSDEVHELCGLKHDSIRFAGDFTKKAIHPDDRDFVTKNLEKAISGDIDFISIEHRILRTDGDVLWVRAQAELAIDAQGNPTNLIGTIIDITKTKQSEETLRASKRLLLETQRIARIGSWELDLATNMITASDEMYRIFGVSPETFDGSFATLKTLIHPEDWKIVKTRIQQLTEQGTTEALEFRIKRPDNSELILHAEGEIIVDDKGKPVRVIGSAQDITERKRKEEETALLEKQLRQSQKMQTLGTLVGGIAHDFNNILQAIRGYADMCLEAVEPETLLHSDLQQVLKGTQRAKDLVRQILTFSHASDRESQPLQIHLIVKEAVKLLCVSLPSSIELRQSIADCGYVLADPVEIEQIVMNLCINSYHAMQHKAGILQISLGVTQTDKQFFQAHPTLFEKTYIRLAVSDTGCGMPPDIQERIFEPFFTTKEVGKGTGLGLSVVHGIVTNAHGDITVSSAPGKGTTFEVYLPQLQGKPGESPDKENLILEGQGHILFVDDDDVIVSVIGRLVKRFGYEVTLRDNSIDALETFQANPDKFDLVITDQIMPKMTGLQLAEKVHTLKPQLPIILMTGFNDNITIEVARKAGIVELLRKPMHAAKLSQAIHRILQKKQE